MFFKPSNNQLAFENNIYTIQKASKIEHNSISKGNLRT